MMEDELTGNLFTPNSWEVYHNGEIYAADGNDPQDVADIWVKTNKLKRKTVMLRGGLINGPVLMQSDWISVKAKQTMMIVDPYDLGFPYFIKVRGDIYWEYLRDWCNEHCGSYNWCYLRPGEYAFVDPDHAMMFRLRWG